MNNKSFIKYFNERLINLLRFDVIRFLRIAEIIQYSLIYLILGFIFGSFVEYYAPNYDPEKSSFQLIFEIIVQTIIITVGVFYIRKIAKLFPFILSKYPGYKPYKITEYHGEIIISVVLINILTKLIDKLNALEDRFQHYIFGRHE